MKLLIHLVILMCWVAMGSATYGNEKKSQMPKKDSHLATHQYQDLKHFFISKITFEKVEFKKAVGMLLAHYQKTCEASHEKPLDFELHIQGVSVGVIDAQFSGNFDYILNQLCAMSGMVLKQSGAQLSLTASNTDKKPMSIHLEKGHRVLAHFGKNPLP